MKKEKGEKGKGKGEKKKKKKQTNKKFNTTGYSDSTV